MYEEEKSDGYHPLDVELRDTEINVELRELSHGVEKLHSELDELVGRLVDVMSTELPKNTGEAKDSSTNTELGKRIRNQRRGVNEARDRVQDIISRLEL